MVCLHKQGRRDGQAEGLGSFDEKSSILVQLQVEAPQCH
jgi:hypothetical protein